MSLALLVASLFYSEVARVVREDSIRSFLSQLDRAQSVLDQQLQIVDTYALRLALNPTIVKLASTRNVLQGSRIMAVRDGWLDLSKNPVPTDLIAELFIFFSDAGVILSPDTPYVRLSFFDADFFQMNGQTFIDWERQALEGLQGQRYLPAGPASLQGRSYNLLPYVRTFPLGDSAAPRSYIIAFLDMGTIGRILLGSAAGPEEWLQISAGGKVVAQLKAGTIALTPPVFPLDQPPGFRVETIRGRAMAVFHADSASSQWGLTAAVPLSVALGRTYFVRNVFAAGMVFLVLAGALAAVFIARWVTRPMRRLLESLSERTGRAQRPPGDEFAFIEETLVSLVERNRDLSAMVERQAPLSRQAFVERLLKGDLTTPEEMSSLSRETGLAIEAPAFVVLLVRVNGYQGVVSRKGLAALSLSRAAVRTVCERERPGQVLLHEVDPDTVAALVSLDTADPRAGRREVDGFARSVREACRRSYGIGTTISAGSFVESPVEICNSFAEAKYSLGQRAPEAPPSQSIQWFGAALPIDPGYYYPVEVEYRIITLTRAGDFPSIAKLLDGVEQENFSKRRLGEELAQALMAELAGTLIKASGEVRESAGGAPPRTAWTAPPPLDMSLGIPAVMDRVRGEFERLCAEVNDRKKSRNWRLKEGIIQHIDASYADPGMCLTSVSSKFDLNEIYLSQFFKEQVGENFHHYLERLRMEKARELLAHSDLSVNEIATRVGYYSAATFRKAFRRVEGTSPLTLRSRGKLEAPAGSE